MVSRMLARMTAVWCMVGTMGWALICLTGSFCCCIAQRKARRSEEIAKIEDMRHLDFNPLHFSMQDGRLLVRGLPIRGLVTTDKSNGSTTLAGSRGAALCHHPTIRSGTMTVHDIASSHDEYDMRPTIHIASSMGASNQLGQLLGGGGNTGHMPIQSSTSTE